LALNFRLLSEEGLVNRFGKQSDHVEPEPAGR